MKRPKDFEEMNNSFRAYVIELEAERDKLNDKIEFLKNQNFDIDKYAERLQKELKTLKNANRL